MILFFFFFSSRRRHTRCSRDWSSDVCSSDLVPVAAGVVGDGGIGAVLAACDMPAEGCGAAALDRRHHLQLVEAEMAGVGLTPGRSMAAENIRELQNRARH